jgi:hypothetical protein
MPAGEKHRAAAHAGDHVTTLIALDEARQALRNGPAGALAVASIAVGLLFAGWIAFYFLLFLPRGAIG